GRAVQQHAVVAREVRQQGGEGGAGGSVGLAAQAGGLGRGDLGSLGGGRDRFGRHRDGQLGGRDQRFRLDRRRGCKQRGGRKGEADQVYEPGRPADAGGVGGLRALGPSFCRHAAVTEIQDRGIMPASRRLDVYKKLKIRESFR